MLFMYGNYFPKYRTQSLRDVCKQLRMHATTNLMHRIAALEAMQALPRSTQGLALYLYGSYTLAEVSS